MKTKYAFLIVLFLTLLAIAIPAPGQTAASGTAIDSLKMLRETLEKRREERVRMERMLAALNQVDSVYKLHYPTWIVKDEDLRERVYKAFRMRYPDVPPDTDVVVVANPDAGEILEISIGGTKMGRRDTYLTLSDSLFKGLLAADYPLQQLSPIREKERDGSTPFVMNPRHMAVSASAFGGTLVFPSSMGIEAKIGRDEIGYHFWSSGDMRIFLTYEQFKLGIVAPFSLGKPSPDGQVVQALSFRPRKLTGAKGVAAEYEQPFTSESVGARISVGELSYYTPTGVPTSTPEGNTYYYIHTAGQLYYSRYLSVGPEHLLKVTGGIGYHQVGTGLEQPDAAIKTIEKENFISPVVRAEYTHAKGLGYGAALQYYSSIVFAHGWMEIVRNVLFIDLKYYAVAFRDPRPWEQPYFFMVSPRIQIMY